MMGFSERQLVLLAITPKCSAALSVVGSFYIFTNVIFSRLRRTKPHHRLLAGMSLLDLFQSSAQFLSTWPSPAGTPDTIFAVGNTTTCTIQGFFTNFDVGVALYNCSLSIYFLSIIKYQCSSERMKKMELIMHVIPSLYTILSGVIIAYFKAFNNAGQTCRISRIPRLCTGDDCVRGEKATIFKLLHFSVIASCLLVGTFSMILIWYTVKTQQLKNASFRTKKKKSKDVAIQAALYIGALYLTWFFPLLHWGIYHYWDQIIFPIYLMSAALHPLQGAFNVLVYMRNELISKRLNISRSFFSIRERSKRRKSSSVFVDKMPENFQNEVTEGGFQKDELDLNQGTHEPSISNAKDSKENNANADQHDIEDSDNYAVDNNKESLAEATSIRSWFEARHHDFEDSDNYAVDNNKESLAEATSIQSWFEARHRDIEDSDNYAVDNNQESTSEATSTRSWFEARFSIKHTAP